MLTRYLRRPLGVPGLRLARVRPGPTVRWHYWWQAQLLDCLVDAQERRPSAARVRRIRALARGVFWRNGVRWHNVFHDDIAWLGLALQRAGTTVRPSRAVPVLVDRLRRAWVDDERGGLPWRVDDEFRNAPAAGPAAILLARSGCRDEAARLADWVHARLTRPDGLIADGERNGGRIEPTAYTYNQGTLLGADLALGRVDRIGPLVRAVDRGLARDGIIAGQGSGDGGLFGGILARYLALVGLTPDLDDDTRNLARTLVSASADAAWQHAHHADDGPVFGPAWSTPADPDVPGTLDLSVQLGGWMLQEAAARLEVGRPYSGPALAAKTGETLLRSTVLARGRPSSQ